MVSAQIVANAFIAFSDPERGDLISNLKVQKLLYYSQGIHLALYHKPIFKEEIVKWQYGPVVPEVYRNLKVHGAGAIPLIENFDFSQFDKNQLEVLHEVDHVYGQFSALKLMQLTHQEPPYNNTELREVISHQELINYFTTQLEDECL